MNIKHAQFAVKAVLAFAALVALAFTIQTHDHLGILLDPEKGFLRQDAERLTRIEAALGIDPNAELFGVESPGCK